MVRTKTESRKHECDEIKSLEEGLLGVPCDGVKESSIDEFKSRR